MTGRVLPYGERALLVELDDLAGALALHTLVGREAPDGLVDVVPGARTVVLVAESPESLPPVRAVAQRALALLSKECGVTETVATPDDPSTAPEVVEVPVHYDGDDLHDVAAHTGLTPRQVVAAHTGPPWRVGFVGFAPGFAYLLGGDPRLRVPRRATPRPRVPAGAVALADEFTGVYPRTSPGGWQLLGHTEVALWDLDRDPPALLRPGMQVRFTDADTGDATSAGPSTSTSRPGAARSRGRDRTGEPADAPWLEVVDPGLLSLVQDAGRPGMAALGVGPSGAADRTAFALGARLLGQTPSEAAVEVLGTLVVRAHGSLTAVVTGAPCPVLVDDGAVACNAPFLLRDGQVLRLGRPTAGLRTYLGVRGGLLAAGVLGSRSHDTLAGLGPPPLRAGDRLVVGPRRGDLLVDLAAVAAPVSGALVLDVLPGPHLHWLADRAQVGAQTWTVAADSDRVGVRLAGDALVRRSTHRDREVPSQGLVRGAVQVPTDGAPVVFLADHPVTGGYPVVAVLTERSADRAAQLVPGQEVRLRLLAAPAHT
jgi:KipI family sensor histidine kinase inhibitor